MKETIYTKEMHERGEAIGSEMMGIYRDKEVLIRLGCDTLRNVVFRFEGEWVTVNVDNIKPIDTRTDKERAIDDVLGLLMEGHANTYNKIAAAVIDRIKAGKIHGITFTGDK